MKRCSWCESSDIDRHYHDTEWGVPVYDDRLLFEMLILEGAQAGVSWHVVLSKRPHYKKVFADFNAVKLSKFTDAKLEKLLLDPGIIRNRLKVFSVRTNAKAFLEIQKEFGSFSEYIWGFVDGKPIINRPRKVSDVPSSSPQSDAMSKDLKKRGFKFIGTTICYAYMQGVGMVNDHVTSCYRYKETTGK
jgi:DNA-3-methyladenine glycosylase I